MVMVNQSLVALTNSVLGTGKATARGNYAYHCPLCHHHKPKLEVNLSENAKGENAWHCWVCDKKGKKLYQLFKAVGASSEKMAELKAIVKYVGPNTQVYAEDNVSLPKEFKTFDNITAADIEGRQALAYLKSRGLSKNDILKYNIGYCAEGKYAKMVIIPSYDANGTLNYFTGRSFEKDPYVKYRNPSVSRDIIPFELYINWSIPLVLCEGPFDALAIKRNVIPLLGKNIQSKLMKKIVTSSVEKIYIALDKDAQKQALTFCERLMNEGKEVYLVDMQDKDPGEMGFENFTKLIQETYPLTLSGLLEKKLSL
jgi:DNA primase